MSNKNKAAPGGDEKEFKDKEANKPDIQPEPKAPPENGTSRKNDDSQKESRADEDSENRDEDLNKESSNDDEEDDDESKKEACCKQSQRLEIALQQNPEQAPTLASTRSGFCFTSCNYIN